MRKYYTTADYKNRNNKRIHKSFKGKQSKINKRVKNSYRIAQLDKSKHLKELHDIKSEYQAVLYPPYNFSLINETELFSEFIGDIQQILNSRKSLFIDLIDLEILDQSSIIVLLAAMVRFRQEKINFNGSIPRNYKISEKFKNSGFLDTLYMKFEQKDDFVIFSGTKDFIARGYNLADMSKALPLIKTSSIHIWGQKRRIPFLYNAIGELMKNTHEHAERNNPGYWNWWISVILMNNRRVGFSFVDFGDGIIESLYTNVDYFEYLFKKKVTDQAKIFEEIISGKIQKSGTREDHRGNGLNSIYTSFLKGDLCKLVIISNSLKLELNDSKDILSNSITKIKNKLKGTYIYWEINERTESLESL